MDLAVSVILESRLQLSKNVFNSPVLSEREAKYVLLCV